jgi:heptaprenyl diphosphate synthase
MSFAALPSPPDSLSLVEARLRDVVRGDGLLGAAAAHLVGAPAAKRARPRLLLAFAELAGARPSSKLVAAAAAVELIHTASLLHDDVVDEADERRGRPSANARYGNSAAVLAGDAILARALGLLAFDPRAVAAAIDVVAAMSDAAVREVEVRGVADLPVLEHKKICDGKTAALFGLCGTLAGLLVDDLDAAARFCGAARALGLAFQIADDAGDVEDDLRERTPTHPILLAAHGDRDIAGALAFLWSETHPTSSAIAALARRIEASPGFAQSHDVVTGFVDEAKVALAPWAGAAAHHAILEFASTLERARGARRT